MHETLKRLEKSKIVGVLRADSEKSALEQARAAGEGGLTAIEITFTTPGALRVIERLAGSSLIVGAGTVLAAAQARDAAAAGATFLVSPHLDDELTELAHDLNIPYIPGVFTPTEVQQARLLGCEMVKVFPIARAGGPKYIKDLRGPFPDLKVMVTGGVGLEDVLSYLEAGVQAIGLGALFADAPAETRAKTAAFMSIIAPQPG